MTSTTGIPVGTRLRLELVLHGRRATDVAKDAGISTPVLSRILANTQTPSSALLERIEAAIRGGAGDA